MNVIAPKANLNMIEIIFTLAKKQGLNPILLSLFFRCYSRARDYCTSGRHVVNMCVNVIRVSVYLQNWSHVVSYVNKATATPDFSDGNLKNHDHQSLLTRLHCAYGLAELATRKYKSAAKRFLAANLDFCDIPDFMSTQVSGIFNIGSNT